MLEYKQYSQDTLSLPFEYTVTSLGPDRRQSQLALSGSRPVSICHGVMKDALDLGEFRSEGKVEFGWGSTGKNKGQGLMDTQTDQMSVGEVRTVH